LGYWGIGSMILPLCSLIGKKEDRIMDRRNANRAFKKLVVWNDAVDLYMLACRVFRDFPFELKKVAANAIDAAHSISRNIADILARHWEAFVAQHKRWIRPVVFENVRKVLACRTPVLGCHVYQCEGCGHVQIVPHSCKSRFPENPGTSNSPHGTTPGCQEGPTLHPGMP